MLEFPLRSASIRLLSETTKTVTRNYWGLTGLMTMRSEPAASTCFPTNIDGLPLNGVEHALAAAIKDGSRVRELLDKLSHGRLWVPLPSGEGPVAGGWRRVAGAGSATRRG